MSEHLFNEAEAYDEMLHRGLRLSGEDKTYFLLGRIRCLDAALPEAFTPRRILDFGCGTGDTSSHLAERFRSAEIVGVDVAAAAVAHASRRHGREGVRFSSLDELSDDATFDLCYSNGAFHHIPPHERADVLDRLRGWLRPGGMFALFENNPLNPGTRLVMSRVPFDKEAKTLRAGTARRLLSEAGFELVGSTRYLFVFPAALRSLRFLEKRLEGLPFGAQYLVLARRPEEAGGGR